MKKIVISFCLLLLNACDTQTEKKELNNVVMKKELNKNNNQVTVLVQVSYTEDIEEIKSIGLAKGGSLENAVVVKGDKVLNEGGLRSKKEFVNHKILDLAGDFMLSGARVIGSLECIHGGHALTNKFLKKIFSDKSNYEVVEHQSSTSNVRKILPLNKRLAAVNA